MENVSEAENLEEGYIRHNRELRKVRAYIRNVSPKGEFEYLFLEYFDQMEAWADAAVKSLINKALMQDIWYMVNTITTIFCLMRLLKKIIMGIES